MPLWIAPCTWTQDAQISKLLRGLWKSPQGSIVDIRDDMATSSHLISCQVGVQKRCFFSNLNWTQPRIYYHRVATGLLWGSSIFGTMEPGETRTTAVCCPASLTLPPLPEEEGISSLYKGIRPTLLGIMPYVTWLTQFRWSSPLASRMENHIF
jgi:hypothetical protein